MPLILTVLLACSNDGPGRKDGERGDTAVDPRERVLALCEEACEVQDEGAGCNDEDFLPWCIQACDTYDGLLPDDCLDEAEAALLCWIDEDWYCDGELSYYEFEQPLPEDPEDCETVTEAFYECG